MLVVKSLALIRWRSYSWCIEMESSKLLRSRRSSESRRKRKKKEKHENAKQRRSRNARLAGGQLPQSGPEEESEEATAQNQENSKETNGPNEMAERYHKHALYFFSKWKEAEMRNVPEIEDSALKQLETEIGRGCFGVCNLAKYGARTVVVKKQDDYAASKNEARMMAKLTHPNIVCLIGVLERQHRLDIVTSFYSVNGDRINLCDIPAETTTINWTNLLNGLCSGIRYLHNKVKVLHNDIKSNNVVLDGCNLFEAEAVLLDFGKATDQNSPKIYDKPADTRKFRHLAPELGHVNGKQSNKSDVYSLGYMIRNLKYKHQNFPSMFVNIYRSCLRTSPPSRPSASDICEQIDN